VPGSTDKRQERLAEFIELAEGVRLLAGFPARLAALDTWGVLVALQALDTAGKDGTIRHVMYEAELAAT
jgi:polyphosphate kinase 2 (PPK2 family)